MFSFFFFFNDTATTEIYTLSLHDALPISHDRRVLYLQGPGGNENDHLYLLDTTGTARDLTRSEEHTSELQSPCNLVCRLLLEKKKTTKTSIMRTGRVTHRLIGHRTSPVPV